MSKEAMKLALEQRITDYLSAGGLFNPELADHLAVRDLLIDCRKALAEPDFWAGYVPERDGTCNNALREQGKAYPRTCKKCGLGPCVELAQQALDKKAANAREQPAQKCSYPYCGCNSKAWCKVERNEALDKMAENARELGLHYEPAQQEPVAWKHDCAALLTNDVELWIDHCPHCGKPRTPPPAQRKPLTDDEIRAASLQAGMQEHYMGFHSGFIRFARAIEAAHGIKENT